MKNSAHYVSSKIREKLEKIALILMLLVLVAGAGNWAIKGFVHSLKEVLVPELTGRTIAEALKIVSEKNLGLKQEGSEFNETIPVGTITRQKPEGGLIVREGKMIRVIVSQGGELIHVPDLSGLSLRSAEIALRSRFLTLGEITEQPSLRFDKNRVLSQDPLPETQVEKNSIVHIVLSEGKPPEGTLLMPDFIGKNSEEVEKWEKEVKISVEKSGDPKGIVTEQDPLPDVQISQNSKVKIVLSNKNDTDTKRNSL